MSAEQPPDAGRRARSLRRTFASVVLVGELLVIGFAVLAARVAAGVPTGQVLAAGGALAVLCLAAAATLRSPLGYALGWVLQVLLIATAYWVPLMAVVGLMFAALWWVAVVKGGQADALTARREAAAQVDVDTDQHR